MRIALHSSERPKRISKAVRNHLLALGRDIPFAAVREAVASMYGYRSWNDLLGQAGRGATSPYDHEAHDGVASERRTVFARRLSERLGLPFDVAQATVDAVGPTSRRPVKAAAWNWPDALERMAANLSRCPVEAVTLVVEGDASGYRCRVAVDPDAVVEVEDREILARKYRLEQPAYELLVRDDGGVIYRTSTGDGRWMGSTVFNGGDPIVLEGFGRRLQEAGLHGGETPDNAPHELVRRTLARLDGHALSLLRAVPMFSPDAYDVARGVAAGSPLGRAIARLPMLGVELLNTVYKHTRFLPADRTSPVLARAARSALFNDPDLVERYLDLVALVARGFHPGIPFDRDAARGTVEAVAAIPVLHGTGLDPSHVAFLSLAPRALLPRTPAQVEAALALADRLQPLFGRDVGMSPEVAFSHFDGDWRALRRNVEETLRAYDDLLIKPFTDLVGRCLFWERGLMPEAHQPWEFEVPDMVLRGRLAPRLLSATHILRYVTSVAVLRQESHKLGNPGLYEPAERLKAARELLRASMILPDGSGNLAPSDIVRMAGVDPDAYVAAIVSGAEASRDELEVSLSLPAQRAAVAESVKVSPCMVGLLSGTTTFHVAEIGGLVLKALHSNHGPYLHVEWDNPDRQGASLGMPASVGWFPAAHGTPAQLWIFTSGQSRLRLPDHWGAAELAALREEFGIGGTYGTADGFLASRAMDGLVAWVESHPRMADRFADDDRDVPGWYHIARCRLGAADANRP